MSKRKISEKARKQYFRLMRETKDHAQREGNWDWGWANMYMTPENLNLLKDIKHYINSQTAWEQRILKKNYNDITVNPDDAKARAIVLKFVQARIDTYKLPIDEILRISTI